MSQDISELMMAAIAAVIAETQADADDPAQVARQPRPKNIVNLIFAGLFIFVAIEIWVLG